MEEILLRYIQELNLPSPQKEYRPGQHRQFRFDYAWPDWKIGVELNGGVYSKKAGHNSIGGLLRDYEKSNYCQILGWLYLQFAPSMLRNQTYAKAVLTKAFRSRGFEI